MRKPKKKKYNRKLGVFKLEDVLPYTGADAESRSYTVEDTSYQVNMTSLRYQVFKHSLECVCCGLKGTYFILELPVHTDKPHFNLYGIENGNPVLITKDHIIPKSKGGTEELDNFQTMCSVCNFIKKNSPLNLPLLRKIRAEYKEVSDQNRLTQKYKELANA